MVLPYLSLDIKSYCNKSVLRSQKKAATQVMKTKTYYIHKRGPEGALILLKSVGTQFQLIIHQLLIKVEEISQSGGRLFIWETLLFIVPVIKKAKKFLKRPTRAGIPVKKNIKRRRESMTKTLSDLKFSD